MNLYNLTQLLTDPENQPHQFVGDPAGLRQAMTDLGYNIPKSLLRPVSGPCVECGQETENRDSGDWIHQACAEEIRRGQERDWKLDSPTHTPYRNLRGGK